MKRLTLYNIIGYGSILLFLAFSLIEKNYMAQSNNILPQNGICAHRGAMETHPENTIPAFQEALRLGAHMIEFDVQLSKDGYLVIMHDATLDRTTDGSGKVASKTLSELKDLDCGSWKAAKFNGTKIPTLDEVLEIMPKNVWLNVHLKGGEELAIETAKKIITAKREDQSIIACGRESALSIKEISSKIKICNMERQSDREEYIAETIINKNEFIQILKKRNSENMQNKVKLLKTNNVKINYYGSDSKEEIDYLFSIGIDFILANKLDSSLKYAEIHGIQRMNY